MDVRNLVKLAQAGDRDAFAALIHGRGRDLVRLVVRKFKVSESEAEELAQQGTVNAYYKIKNLRNPELFNCWLRAITLNAACASIRSAERQRRDVTRVARPIAYVASPLDAVVAHERKQRLRECVRRLPTKHRQVIRLMYLKGKSTAEIIALLQIPEGAVKRRLFDARQRLLAMVRENDSQLEEI